MVKLCECGCGLPTKPAPCANRYLKWVKGRPIRFINGHNRKGVIFTEKHRRHLSEARKGKPLFSLRGRPRSEITKQRISRANKGQVPWCKGKTIPALWGRTPWNKGKTGFKHTQKAKQKISIGGKAVWKSLTSEQRDIRVHNALWGKRLGPNKPERIVSGILHRLYPYEWSFVGDGQIVIGGRNPDFMCTNGRKQFIEVFGDYWHRYDNPYKRIKLFRQYGFDTLVIWERELKSVLKVSEKIRKFCESSNARGFPHG